MEEKEFTLIVETTHGPLKIQRSVPKVGIKRSVLARAKAKLSSKS
jgi:hypothetical protein